MIVFVAPPLRCGHVTELCVLQVITLSGAIGLQSNSACLLGHLYLAHVSNSSSPTAGELLGLSTKVVITLVSLVLSSSQRPRTSATCQKRASSDRW